MRVPAQHDDRSASGNGCKSDARYAGRANAPHRAHLLERVRWIVGEAERIEVAGDDVRALLCGQVREQRLELREPALLSAIIEMGAHHRELLVVEDIAAHQRGPDVGTKAPK